ncbi:MAG: tryptophan 2-C-methyltransferase [Polyangiales bacterium]
MSRSPSVARGLVTLINPNFVRPTVTPYALDILTSHLEQDGFDVEVLDLTWRRDDWSDAVRQYFSSRNPMLVGVTIRNACSVQPQEQRVFLPDHRAVIDAVRSATEAPIVLGGAGFSSMPFAAMQYFDVEFGVKGPGELILCELARALAEGRSPETVADLLLRDGAHVRRSHASGASPVILRRAPVAGATLGRDVEARYARRSNVAHRVDNRRYYDHGGLGNLLTKSGCPFSCNHCLEPDAKGRVIARRSIDAVLDEMESMVDQGIFDLHTTDSEFNLALGQSKALLRALIARRRSASSNLSALRLWIYAHPLPFDEELADLLAEAGCRGASLSAEHVAREHLAQWSTAHSRAALVYSLDDVRRMTDLLAEREIMTTVELLLGLPGETIETVRAAIDATLALRTTVVGYTLGLQVFPYAPLGELMAERSAGRTAIRGLQSNTAKSPIVLRRMDQCGSIAEYERQFWFDEEGRIRPVFYFSPELPEDPETIARPDGRWESTIRWIQSYVPVEEHYRVALPTVAGDGNDDNNYADNPFLLRAVALGFKGAYYSWWRRREEIMAMPAPRA